jgi:hypothetical protein
MKKPLEEEDTLLQAGIIETSLLAYLIVDFRTGTSLVELWFWTVSRWDI